MAGSRRVLVRLIIAVLLATLPGWVFAAGAAKATSDPPTIVAATASGPPGLTVGLSGLNYEAGTTYALCLLPPDEAQCGSGSGLGSFTADSAGRIPAGTQVRVPGVVAGSYLLVATAPGTAAIVATLAFSVTGPTLSLGSEAGPGGLVIGVTGSGYAPSTAYSLCIVPSGTPECGGIGILLGDVTADGSGDLPASTTVTIPGQLPASYDLGVMLKGAAVPNLLASNPFVEVAPTIALDPAAGPGGTVATVTGAGLAPGGKYIVCIVPRAATSCGGAGTNLASFTADASGSIPVGTMLTIPAGVQGDFPVGILLSNSTAFLLGSVTFSRTGGTAPPSSGPSGPTAGPAASETSSGRSSSPSTSTASTSSDQGSGGSIMWLLIALAIMAVVVVGLVLSRRRRSTGRG